MTVSSTSSRIVYQGNGATTSFPFAFKVLQAADLVVVYTDATGTDFPLSPSQYAATGFGLDAGGTVTYPLSGSPIAAGSMLTIYRSVAPTQPASISNQGAMWPQVIEAALDRGVMIAQGFLDAISRALVVDPTDGGALSPLPGKALRANSYLAFDANGQPIATQNLSLASVSAWLATNFLPQTTAAAALAVLGGVGAAINNTFTAINDFTGGRIKVPTRTAGDSGTDAASTAFVSASLRGSLGGLGLSTAGASATFSVAAGQATDSTNTGLLVLAAAISKTTGAWAVGIAAGALDAGAIANTSWYHVHLIKRVDTGLVDVLISLSATAPTLPANYTLFRRIGSMQTNSSAQWVSFVQDGDLFQWSAYKQDVSIGNPGTSAVSRTLSVPTGLNVWALIQIILLNNENSIATYALVSDLAITDQTPSSSLNDTGLSYNNAGGNDITGGIKTVRTSTNAQVRTRLGLNSTTNIVLTINTMGWIDRRGRDA